MLLSKEYVYNYYSEKIDIGDSEYDRVNQTIKLLEARKAFEDWLTIKYPGTENESVREDWVYWFDEYLDRTLETDCQAFTINNETVYGYCLIMENEETLVKAAEEQTTEQAYAADEMLLHQIRFIVADTYVGPVESTIHIARFFDDIYGTIGEVVFEETNTKIEM